MSEEERRALLAQLEAAAEEIRQMTPEQALERLRQEGYIDEDGDLRPEYGGPEKGR